MNHRHLLLPLAVAASLLTLSACRKEASPEAAPATAPSAAVSVPADAVTLRDLGLTNAPEGVSLPKGAVVSDMINMGNNVTAVVVSPSGAEVAEHLRTALPAAGFTITADGADSLLFEGGAWQGAFTVNGEVAALSLRTDR